MTSIFWFCALAGVGASVARLTPKLASTSSRPCLAETCVPDRLMRGWNPDLSVPGHPELFVIGDLANCKDPRTGKETDRVTAAQFATLLDRVTALENP